MATDPLELFKLLSGGDLAASAGRHFARADSDSPIAWEQTPFRDLKLIGRGGMGAVFRAHDQRVGRPVALKLLLSQSQAARERFLREGRLAARLSHPNVVQVHDLLEFPQGDVLVCALLTDARPLDVAWRDLGLARRVELLRDASRGVAAAHDLGVVHRDLKPENILVDAQGRAQIADFGVAYGANLERLTQSGTTLGTPSFMAPEQLGVSRSAAPTASADVWSLGVILYLALSDELPFQGSNLLQIAGALQRGYDSEQMRALAGSPTPLRELVRDCLVPDPERRPQSAHVFADRLQAWLERPNSLGSRRRVWAPSLLVGATLLCVLLYAQHSTPKDDAPPSATPTFAANLAEAALPVTPARGQRRQELVAQALSTLRRGEDLATISAKLQELRALSKELPLDERGALESEVLNAVALRILANDTFDSLALQTLKTLADTGARLQPVQGIRLVERYLSQSTFGRYQERVQQALFLLLLRLDAPTPYLSLDQFTQGFGPLGPPTGPEPWERFARLRTLVKSPKARESLLQVLRQPPPGFLLGPSQWSESISEIVAVTEDPRQLLPDLLRALERNPGCPVVLYRIAQTRAAEGETKLASATYERMLAALRAQSYPTLRATRNYFGRKLHVAAAHFAEIGAMDRARELIAEGSSYPVTSSRTSLLEEYPELRQQ